MSLPLSPNPPPVKAPEKARGSFFVTVAQADPETVVVTPVGEADLNTAYGLHRALSEATANYRVVIIDLDHLTFMDASTLGLLAETHNRVLASGGRFKLRCHAELARRLLAIGGMGMMIDDSV